MEGFRINEAVKLWLDGITEPDPKKVLRARALLKAGHYAMKMERERLKRGAWWWR